MPKSKTRRRSPVDPDRVPAEEDQVQGPDDDPGNPDELDEGPTDPEDLVAPVESGDVEVDAIELSEDAAEIVQQLEAERDAALAARTRALADYANYQRRASENEIRARWDGVCQAVRSILPVLDNFDLALGQDLQPQSLEQFAAGVRLVREELFRALESHGVTVIAPPVGGEFDPMRHEAMLRQEAEGIDPGCIVSVLQPGYALGDLVLRAAKVAVAPSED